MLGLVKTEWDYTPLAAAYLKRPEYAEGPIQEMLETARLLGGASVCDVGAGTGHLTVPLAKRGFHVTALEPNEAMRRYGIERTISFPRVLWRAGTGEETGLPSSEFDLVIFGSSFNVTNRPLALKESARILKGGGWFACLWNHRDLSDPLQAAIEKIIHSHISPYDYGARREDQSGVIEASGLFGEVRRIEDEISTTQTVADCVEAWRSHATLRRQAGDKFELILTEISERLASTGKTQIQIPYATRIWFAQSRGK